MSYDFLCSIDPFFQAPYRATCIKVVQVFDLGINQLYHNRCKITSYWHLPQSQLVVHT